MSTIRDTRVVDWISIEKSTGTIELTVFDDLDWSNEQEHLVLLQDKLNTYLAFIESGELVERLNHEFGHSVTSSVPVEVSIVARYEATPKARKFLDAATQALKDAGFSLSHRVALPGHEGTN